MRLAPLSLLLLLLPCLPLAACGGGETPDAGGDEASAAGDGAGVPDDGTSDPDAVAVSPAKAEEAAEMYASFCSTCHGKDGKGRGPASAALDPKPASFAKQAWQEAISDEQILTVIREGGAAVGKSPAMVAAPGAWKDPELAQALLEIVREFGP